MIYDMDKVQFENKIEIGKIIKALENSSDKDDKDVKRLIDILDVMLMNW